MPTSAATRQSSGRLRWSVLFASDSTRDCFVTCTSSTKDRAPLSEYSYAVGCKNPHAPPLKAQENRPFIPVRTLLNGLVVKYLRAYLTKLDQNSREKKLEINATKTVRDLAVELPNATRVFEKLGIDYCCGGSRSLGEAC